MICRPLPYHPLTYLCGALVGSWLFCGYAAAMEPQADPAALEFFEKKVRPVLLASCIKCHGGEKQESGLRVDSLAALLAGGESGPALVPSKPEESLLIGAINHGEVFQMPPKTKLPAAQIADLTAWVKMGAPWPNAKVATKPTLPRDPNSPGGRAALFTAEEKAFWAFQSPMAAPLPSVKQPQWCQSPIDYFILAGLEAKGLSPAPAADKLTLIRRATFDLLGLPPTPEEVTAFLADDSPQAFERVIERLLASPHYGQRWARHWLDVARYADSNGMDENVAYANAFRYRDYVVAALNQDKPYDQFLREQIAGDLLPASNNPDENAARLTATGFLVIGPKMLAEDDPLKMEMDIVDEQLDTVGRTFLGLTLGCARCHDHKFDPLPTADYYSLAAIFKSTKTMENFRVVAMWNERPIASPEQIAERDRIQSEVTAKKQTLAARERELREQIIAAAKQKSAEYFAAASEFRQQQAAVLKPLMNQEPPPPGALVIEAEKYDRGNVKRDTTDYGDKIGVIYNAGELPNFAEYDFEITEASGYQLELRFAAAESRPTKLLLDGKLIVDNAAVAVTGGWQPDKQAWAAEGVVTLAAGKHTLRLERAGPFPHFDKWALVPRAVMAGEPPVPLAPNLEKLATDKQLHVLFLRQWVKYLEQAATAPTTETLPQVAADPKGPFATPKEIETLYPADVKDELRKAREELTSLEKTVPVLPMAMGASEGKVTNLKVHLRGNYLTLGAEVPRQFPQIIAGEQQTPIDANQSGRLQLANWMTQPDHPLTSRVMVNRVWHWHFGAGIVRSTDNFGRLGEAPDNQPLLDWLAMKFTEQGWSLKALHRTLMLSSTYQMGTTFNEQAALADPENRLRWRADRRRLEAEALRDAILAVSGQLDVSMGGTLMNVENHKYVTSTASKKFDAYHVPRRTIYLPITRSSVYDLLQAFDIADPSSANGQRASTTIAPQALALMNSRLMAEQSLACAQSLLSNNASDDAQRVSLLYQRAYGRQPSELEAARAIEFVRRVEASVPEAEAKQLPAKVQAWRSLCRVVLSSSEFVYVE